MTFYRTICCHVPGSYLFSGDDVDGGNERKYSEGSAAANANNEYRNTGESFSRILKRNSLSFIQRIESFKIKIFYFVGNLGVHTKLSYETRSCQSQTLLLQKYSNR